VAVTIAAGPAALPLADLLLDAAGELRPLVDVDVDGRDARELGGLDARSAGEVDAGVVAAVAGA
jgi:hypothetical protein